MATQDQLLFFSSGGQPKRHNETTLGLRVASLGVGVAASTTDGDMLGTRAALGATSFFSTERLRVSGAALAVDFTSTNAIWASATGSGNILFAVDTQNGRLSIGTSNPLAPIDATVNDAVNGDVTNLLRLNHNTTGTAANGIGSGILFTAENAGGTTNVNSARIAGSLITATAGSEAGALLFSALSSGSLVSRMRITGAGTQLGNIGGLTAALLEMIQPAQTSGNPKALKITGGAHTTLTPAGADFFDVDLVINRTVNFTAGAAINWAGGMRIGAGPTFTASASQTVNNLSTLRVEGEPTAGTNLVGDLDTSALSVSGRTIFFADKPTGSATDYQGLTLQVELGGGTQSADFMGGAAVVALLGSSVLSGTAVAVGWGGVGLHKSTGTATRVDGLFGTFRGSGPGVALGTVTHGAGVTGEFGYDDDDGLPTSGSITNGYCFRGLPPINISAARAVPTARCFYAPNMGATGVTNAYGIDIEAQSGASSVSLGARIASGVRITSGGLMIGLDSSPSSGVSLHVDGGDALLKSHSAFASSGAIRTTSAVQTTNATVTALKTIALADNTVYTILVFVEARRTDVAGRSGFYRRAVVFREAAGAATLVGTVDTIGADKTSGTITASVDVVVTGDNLVVQVTGAAAQTINWACGVDYQGVSGNA
jgi:hypothetical protein